MRLDPERIMANLAIRSTRTRQNFYEDMASAQDDGVDIVSYLTKRLNRAKQMKDPLGPIYRHWLNRMNSMGFSAALKNSGIPDSEVMIIAAAEASSTLAESLRFLAKSIGEISAMRAAVLAAMAVPMFVLSIVCGLIYTFSVTFVPVLSTMMPDSKWPASGLALKAVANFMTGYGPALLMLTIGVIVAFVWSINNWVGQTRKTFDEYPPYSVFRSLQGAITLVAMASLMAAGTSLNDTLNQIAKSSGGWVRWHMHAISRRLDKFSGEPGRAFDTGMLSQQILNRIIDRSERSDFGSALKSIGLTILMDVRKEVEANAKKLNLLMLVIAACAMGFLMYGFLDTVYSIRNAFKL